MSAVPPDIQARVDAYRAAEGLRAAHRKTHEAAVERVTEIREAIARLPGLESELRRELRDLQGERASDAWRVLSGDEADDARDATLVERITRIERRLGLVPMAAEWLAMEQKQRQLVVNRMTRD